MNLILFSVTTFAVLDYFYRFMRFVSTDLAKIAKFLCFYSKSGLLLSDVPEKKGLDTSEKSQQGGFRSCCDFSGFAIIYNHLNTNRVLHLDIFRLDSDSR